MARLRRTVVESDSDNQREVRHSERKRARIHYNEDAFFSDLDDDQPHSSPSKKVTLTLRSTRKEDESHDSEYAGSNRGSEFTDDDFLESERKRSDRQFVVDNESPDEAVITTRSSRRSTRQRPRTPTPPAVTSEDDLRQELEDLKDSPPNSPPRKVKLRERTNPINYQIPPPLNDFDKIRPAPRGKPAGPLRRLFPTVGPFGGGDVTSVFGKSSHAGLTAAGNVESSDSSDDEKGPKKSKMADSDPLGIDTNIDFSKVGGLENYIQQLKEMVSLPLMYPEVYSKFGITPPRGVLFHGPPGTGKTLMARALASSCSTADTKITFFMRKGADCLSKWVGEAERQLRLLFEEAKTHQPSIIFFDEIDGLAPVRSSKQEQIHASIVSTLLALMDGMDNRGQVIVIGATNRPDSVDPALRRPGRFDREFYFPLPDLAAREQILKIHTTSWDPPLAPEFLVKLAELTKGFGGADLRALCTESALNSIQREYPQIYQQSGKLKIDVSKIKVSPRDFLRALDKIVPSSKRSVSSGSSPLPEHVRPLLTEQFSHVIATVDHLVPREKKLTNLQDAMFVDPTISDKDGGFRKQQLLSTLNTSRVFKPKLLVYGPPGLGQNYIGGGILNRLEGFNVQSLELSRLFTEGGSVPMETVIVHSFLEARRQSPAVLFIPNADIWLNIVPESVKMTLVSLLRSLDSCEKVVVLCLSESEDPTALENVFGFSHKILLQKPSHLQIQHFFDKLWIALELKPLEFNDPELRPKRSLAQLELVEKSSSVPKPVKSAKSQEKRDMRLKNMLKLKLSGLMDLFKTRYRRFKKPAIDDNFLIHLFDPTVVPADQLDALPYQRDHNMILEVASGKRYFNMDLEIIEERLWNGFYSEPKQFLKDVEMIYKDAKTMGERDRVLKASEMFANAQVGIEEVVTKEFAAECKMLRERMDAKGVEILSEKVVSEKDGEDKHEVEDENQAVEPQVDQTGEESLAEPLGGQTREESLAERQGADKIEGEEDKQGESQSDESEVPSLRESPTPVNGESLIHQNGSVQALEKDLIIDLELLAKVKASLLSKTVSFTVEQLEKVNASLMEIVWENRKMIDKTAVLHHMLRVINGF